MARRLCPARRPKPRSDGTHPAERDEDCPHRGSDLSRRPDQPPIRRRSDGEDAGGEPDSVARRGDGRREYRGQEPAWPRPRRGRSAWPGVAKCPARQPPAVIVVATADFELYHEVVTALRERGVEFTTIEPGEAIPEGTTVLVHGADEETAVPAEAEVAVVEADAGDPRAAVDAVAATLRDGDGRTVVGVDPGERPGVAVLEGDTVTAVFQVPAERVAGVVREEVADAADPLVRVGDGARLVGARLLEDLPDVPVELVDESGTTPYLGTGVRGVGDVLAAVNIARREGERVRSRDVEPTEGELTRIQDRSREASETNRAVDVDLARRVAAGELSIEEALAEHADDTTTS